MTESEALRYWKQVAGDSSSIPWTKNDLVGFFQRFRPYGKGVKEAFNGIAGADEIVARLGEIYEVTAPGWQPTDAYFLVKEPKPLSAKEGRHLTEAHLQCFFKIASRIASSDLMKLLDPIPTIEVCHGQPPATTPECELEILIDEARTDFMLSLAPMQSEVLLLKEAFYSIACDYLLRDYILWPLYSDASPVQEPFRSYFALWTHGASIQITGNEAVKVFLPNLLA